MSPLNANAVNATWGAQGLLMPPSVLSGDRDAPQIHSVAFLSDSGKRSIGGPDDESVPAWKLENGCQVGTLIEDGGRVYAVAASSDGQWIATAQGNTLAIWNAKTDGKVVELNVQVCSLCSLCSGPVDLRGVASGSDHGVWAGSHSLGFAPNRGRIVGCDPRDVRTWNHSGKLVTLSPPDGYIFDSLTGLLLGERKRPLIAVSLNAKFIVSGSCVRVWDATTYTRIPPNLQHDDQVDSVAIPPGDIHLAGYNKEVRIWSVKGSIPSTLGATRAPPALRFHVSTRPPGIRLPQVHQADGNLKRVSSPPLREAQELQSIMDDNEGKHPTEVVDSEEVDVALWRQPHGSSSRPCSPDVSSAAIATQQLGRSRIPSKVNLGRGVVENPEQPPQDTAWSLDNM
ncbi:hypothetical protein PAXRUDRAFT_26746 [Paxillus rubicundulus Ve08.2h10]|uniref:Uncharacterized protein n=1 Tax=Paxillus rubicundulus Ve08.2h10 TaxID=930991 RepID=A0A0D0E4S5_9AGAM|nr:hypothetical protein PAXRUDRAFT_26746 [Paxillus rubicundulus Ve08.2h10]